MTLEKLLIFGAGLAVVAALAVSAQTVSSNRSPQHDTYKENVIELIEVK
ncbi:MAG: hypothetical protein AAFQ64_15025 [Pseudomonadota bacterium]